MRMISVALSAILLFVAAATSQANTPPHPQIDAQAILGKQEQIRAQVEARKGPFKDLSPALREELFKQQSIVSSLLQDKSLLTDLPERDRITVFNSLERISAIITEAEDEQLVCERVRPTGSNRPVTQCLTVAQRREARENGQKQAHYRDGQCIKVLGQCDFNAGTSAGGSVQSDVTRP